MIDAQLYLNAQNLVKPEPHHYEQSVNYEQGHCNPVDYQYETGTLDTRLLSCIAQEGSESPWYWQNGDKEALTPTQDGEMMDDY